MPRVQRRLNDESFSLLTHSPGGSRGQPLSFRRKGGRRKPPHCHVRYRILTPWRRDLSGARSAANPITRSQSRNRQPRM